MRNYWSPIPPPPSPPFPPPGPPGHYGEPIRGEIINGRLFPLGCVSEEDYAADKAAINSSISEIEKKHEADITAVNAQVLEANSAIITLKDKTADNSSSILLLGASLNSKAEKSELNSLAEKVSKLADGEQGVKVYIQDNEPDDTNCFWFKPVSNEVFPYIAMLQLSDDTSKSNIFAEINGKNYAVENVVDTPEELTAGKYNFEIFKTKE